MVYANINRLKNTALIILGITCLLLMLFTAGCTPVGTQEETNEEEKEEEQEAKEESNGEETPSIQPIGVVIDNSSRARPQSGLQRASTIYEFLVEGGITRFLAIYDRPAEEDFHIGPVRSLRPYLAEKITEYGGVVAHGGYSSRTADIIRNLDLKHLDSSHLLWRDGSRSSPHNLYTNIEKLRDAVGKDEIQREPGTPLKKVEVNYETGEEINLDYRSHNQVSYSYHSADEKYYRYINNQPHRDLSEKQYSAQRVILQTALHQDVPNSDLVEIDISDGGEGILYEKGRKYPITWDVKGGATHYYFEDGSRVDTTQGTTWVQIIPPQ